MFLCLFSNFVIMFLQVEEVEGQVVVKADKRDLLRGRRAPPVLQVNKNFSKFIWVGLELSF